MKHARILTRAAANIVFPPVNENPVVTRDADWSHEPDHQAYLPPLVFAKSRPIRKMWVGAVWIELSRPLQTRKLFILGPDKIIKNA
jgi:hypothetical protein